MSPYKTPVIVVTTNLADQSQSTERIIDHDVREDRVWLGKHCFWAMRNGYEVSTRPLPQTKNP